MIHRKRQMPRPRETAKPQAVVELPASATHAVVAWIGVASMLAAVTALNFWAPDRPIYYQALFVMACAALGIFVPDLLWQRVYQRSLTAARGPGNAVRVATKCAGLLGSVAFVVFLYWLFPEYNSGEQFYGNYYRAMKFVLIPWALLAPLYIYFVDRRLATPEDGLWQMGRLMLGQWRGLDARVIWQHLLGWLVKGFFLPLMFTYFCDNLNRLLHYDVKLLYTFPGFFDWAYFSLYFIDVSLVSMTYLMSLKATDTQIRSTEPTAMGWVSALVCYQPFWSTISRQYIDYESGPGWGVWLSGIHWLYDLWAVLILLLVAIYVWATIAFGARFSNLTHRGIITNGPYRFTKHPAYLSKNLSWWLMSMPFMLSGSLQVTIRSSVLLACLNLIYFLRAKTEERHLSLDPAYVQYARWIDEHGALRLLNGVPLIGRLARWRLSFTAYTAPTPIQSGVLK
jgi:protein-S-isoprenylcysteine O-methyltransferase Ste14